MRIYDWKILIVFCFCIFDIKSLVLYLIFHSFYFSGEFKDSWNFLKESLVRASLRNKRSFSLYFFFFFSFQLFFFSDSIFSFLYFVVLNLLHTTIFYLTRLKVTLVKRWKKKKINKWKNIKWNKSLYAEELLHSWYCGFKYLHKYVYIHIYMYILYIWTT